MWYYNVTAAAMLHLDDSRLPHALFIVYSSNKFHIIIHERNRSHESCTLRYVYIQYTTYNIIIYNILHRHEPTSVVVGSSITIPEPCTVINRGGSVETGNRRHDPLHTPVNRFARLNGYEDFGPAHYSFRHPHPVTSFKVVLRKTSTSIT